MISVYIVTKNEEHNIERAISSVNGLGEVIVVDSGSTDKTIELATKCGAKVSHHDWQGMAQQKEHAKNLCANEWVLNLDADEEISPELKSEITDVIKRKDIAGANIPIEEYFLGFPIHGKTKKNSHVRLFKKNKGTYGHERFHETPTVDGNIINLKGGIRHYGEISIEVKVSKINLYSSGKAIDKFEKGKGYSLLKLVSIMPLAFIKSYVLKRNFFNGVRGFIGSMINAFYAFLKEAKLYEANLKRRQKN